MKKSNNVLVINHKADIVKSIKALSGKYSPYQVFYDWVELSAIAIANNCVLFHDDVWNQREKHFLQVIEKYDPQEQTQFSNMFAMLVDEFELRVNEKKLTDVLGEIYMESGAGNKNLGQVFTPYNLALMTAKLAVEGYEDNNTFTFNEPACGGGAMIIGVAQNLLERGINYQRVMKGVCQDLDIKCVYMCYLQLSLLGIDAIVVQGDTLCDPYTNNYPKERIYRTPKNTGLLI